MKLKKSPIIFIALSINIIFISCQNKKTEQVIQNDTTKEQKAQVDSLPKNVIVKSDNLDLQKVSCDTLLCHLIRSSSLDTAISKFSIDVDEVDSNIIKIKIFNTNEGAEVVVSWIDMDTTKKELRNVTIDPDNPIKLKCDTALFNTIVRRKCW